MRVRHPRRYAVAGAFAVALTASAAAQAAHQPGFGHANPLVAGQQTITSCTFGLGPCLSVDNNGTDGTGVLATGSTGVQGGHPGTTGTGPGVVGATNSTDTGAIGVLGLVSSTTPGGASSAVRGINNGTGVFGIGVWGSHAGSGTGGYFTTGAAGTGVQASAGNGGTGVFSFAAGPGLAWGVVGETGSSAANAAGVRGLISSNAANAAGMRGINFHGMCCGMGVFGEHLGAGIGVYGEALNGFAVSGFSPNNWSGYFQGSVRVVGNLQKNSGSFTIDHPLDPENKYLSHSFVESPDMKNVYDGNVTTDAKGFATVKLPRYFGVLNRDFRYQLTAIGQPAQMWIAKKIRENHFTIRTDKPGVEVSWQVTGIRKDRWANAHRIKVEELKKASERGKYLNPELYGKPLAESVVYLPGLEKTGAKELLRGGR